MGGTSRVSREAQARICERLGAKFPGATRPRGEIPRGYSPVALFCRHRLGRDDAALWLFTCFVDHRHILCCVYQKPPPRRPESSLSIVATRFSTRWEHLTPNMGLGWTLKLRPM